MIKDFKQGERVTITEYQIAFDDGYNNGFGFPCDKDGNPLTLDDNPAAKRNYEYCMAHPEEFVRHNEVVAFTRTYRENNSGICDCGNRIELYNSYLGACECPHCGRWYNTFGQELNPPETWSEGDDW